MKLTDAENARLERIRDETKRVLANHPNDEHSSPLGSILEELDFIQAADEPKNGSEDTAKTDPAPPAEEPETDVFGDTELSF